MGNEAYHAKLAREKKRLALDEFAHHRYTTVGVLALRAVVEALDACASRKKLHFHTNQRTAQAERSGWLKKEFPELTKPFNTLLSTYEYFRSPRHSLGYERASIYLAWWRFQTPEHGDREKTTIDAMEKILDVLQKKTKIRFK